VGEFAARHIGPNDQERRAMLLEVGFGDIESFIKACVPGDIATGAPANLPPARSEAEVLEALKVLASRNQPRKSMIGMGYYSTITPSVIRRNVLENPAWYTAYTPYQAEISQGRLEALLVFQTVIEELTGLPIANASLLDEPTAAAEAMTLAHRVSKSDSQTFLVDQDTHPQTLAVLNTRAEPLGVTVLSIDLTLLRTSGVAPTELPDHFGFLISNPSSRGGVVAVEELAALAKRSHEMGASVIAATDLLALMLIAPPGEWGADIAIGSAQRFGVPMGFGGPHAGFIAVKSGLERQLPGRLVGVSVDSTGRPAYRLSLQTREQHIRRDKATSNICTSQVLLAVVAAMYAAYHGPTGLKQIAQRVNTFAEQLANELNIAGAELVYSRFFDTVTFRCPGKARALLASLAERGIDIRLLNDDEIAVSCDELTTDTDLREIATTVREALHIQRDKRGKELAPGFSLAGVATERVVLTQPMFSDYRSETAMMRWLRRMADADLALDRSMIPLGSCTMKLNSAVEMESVTWPEFANLHPFGPADAAQGTLELIANLSTWLASITGYDAVSLQPNAGSQGEFAGLMAIRGYHMANGDTNRTVCIIPESAHGTNAASAVMCGMNVVVVKCDANGDVDLDELGRKIDENRDQLAAVMITYPSTHGVFEAGVRRICEMVHAAGGQVYVDGANMNALVGVAAPANFGADVSHLNLHKTFCIPHGGGGPGVGPIGVMAHLAPYMPTHPLAQPEYGELCKSEGPVGPVSGAPFGSAGVLTIPWAYIALMGATDLRDASLMAILNANYLAKKLAKHYSVLYTNSLGLVAHECVIDIRPITAATGVTAEDIAKRLMDYGFHAPTMSWPVAGTLMIEPTESESLAELDRFIEAMARIRCEIGKVESGQWNVEESPLRLAPHTAEDLVSDWTRPYSRDEAVYPMGRVRAKYWPPVNRIDAAFGDRNLVCACPPVSAFSS